MKVLIAIPAYQLSSEVMRRVHAQNWDDPSGFGVYVQWGADMLPWENRFQAITRKYQELQRIFLAGPWDALLTVEQDMYIPLDALQRLSQLLRDGADVAYGLYVWRYTDEHRWSAHPRLDLADGAFRYWSLTHEAAEARRLWGGVVRVAGLGLGCTMIARHTLARVGFRQATLESCCDAALALDCQQEGLIQVCDTGVVCGHRLDDGRIIWPDPATDTLYRIEEAC